MYGTSLFCLLTEKTKSLLSIEKPTVCDIKKCIFSETGETINTSALYTLIKENGKPQKRAAKIYADFLGIDVAQITTYRPTYKRGKTMQCKQYAMLITWARINASDLE